MKMRFAIHSILPQSLIDVYRASRRRLRWRRARAQKAVVTKADILEGLSEIGVRPGDVLLVHSSLSRLGDVEGGVDIVIDALLEAVGSAGTIVMPAYPMPGHTLPYVQTDPLFDPRRTPATSGRISDTFWRRPGVLRSLHPTHSAAAYGPKAEYLVQDHEKGRNPFGKESPYQKVIELDGRILQLACPWFIISSFHIPEVACPEFPLTVYLPDLYPVRYLDWDGVEHTALTEVHDPAMFSTGVHLDKEIEARVFNDLIQGGIMRIGSIGQAKLHLLDARAFEEYLEHEARNGRSAYR